MYLPSYVYKITIKETNQFYFGYRKANKCIPEEDFLIKYFSSSKIINEIIATNGIDSITGEIVYTDTDHNATYWKEQSLIEQHYTNPLILNQHYQKTNKGFKMFLTTPEASAKMVATRKLRGCQSTPEYIKRQQEIHNKKYIVFPPNGEESYIIFGLKAHCDAHNLNHPAMSQVGLGKKTHHKGWKCIRIYD